MTSDALALPRHEAITRSALVLYATETGNAEDIALSFRPFLRRLCFSRVEVIPADDLPDPSYLHHYDLCIFVVATTGQGDFPTNARKFWRMMLRKRLVVGKELQGVTLASVGLGDRSYLKFNWAARKVRKRLLQLGGSEVCEGCEADESGEEGVEGGVNEWLVGFEAKVKALWNEGDDYAGQPVGAIEGPRWLLSSATDGIGGNAQGHDLISDDNSYLNGTSSLQASSRPTMEDEFPVTLTLNQRVTPPDHWQDVRLLRFHTPLDIDYMPGDALCLFPENDLEDVNTFLELMDWTDVADVPVVIKPGNLLTCTTSSPHSHPTLEKPPLPHLAQTHSGSNSSQPTTTTLRWLLLTTLDIRAIPRRSFFRTLATYCTEDAFQRDRLLEFTDPQYLDEYFDYATRPRRSILEILQEFKNGVRVPWQEVLELLPVLRARQFSIASSRREAEFREVSSNLEVANDRQPQQKPGGGTTFELLVAIVKYRTVIRRVRRGVCTHWLEGLPVGTPLHVALRTDGRFIKNRNDLLRRSKHVLVGAGTGLAPLRSLVWEKEAMQLHLQQMQHDGPAPSQLSLERDPTGHLEYNEDDEDAKDTTASTATSTETTQNETRTLLIFGARNSSQDFFFKDEWLSLHKHHRQEGRFQLRTAFSRDQPQKIYVQDRIREHASQIRRMIVDGDAVFVVCGSAGQMPRAVRTALVDVLSGQASETVDEKKIVDAAVVIESTTYETGMMSQDEAEQYIVRMEKEGRYLQETWS